MGLGVVLLQSCVVQNGDSGADDSEPGGGGGEHQQTSMEHDFQVFINGSRTSVILVIIRLHRKQA